MKRKRKQKSNGKWSKAKMIRAIHNLVDACGELRECQKRTAVDMYYPGHAPHVWMNDGKLRVWVRQGDKWPRAEQAPAAALKDAIDSLLGGMLYAWSRQ